jgi:methionine synthase II (cobalamin-independent)
MQTHNLGYPRIGSQRELKKEAEQYWAGNDIHSPRVPSKEEMVALTEKAKAVIPSDQLWVNPDCGLKTRNWPETKAALIAMVAGGCNVAEDRERACLLILSLQEQNLFKSFYKP